jgi:hypothetical protein
MPLPEPFAPEVIWIHHALLVADQEQPAAADTATLLVPPSSEKSSLVGEIT